MDLHREKRQKRICDGCALGRNCINGRWCVRLSMYVEHLDTLQGRTLCDDYKATEA